MASAALTKAQALQMRELSAAGAVDRDSARGPWDGMAVCNPMVLGKLRGLGLADSRTIKSRNGSGQFTAYWLTPAGVARARQDASS